MLGLVFSARGRDAAARGLRPLGLLGVAVVALGACAAPQPPGGEAPRFPRSAFLSAPLPSTPAAEATLAERMLPQRASLTLAQADDSQADEFLGDPDYDEEQLFGAGEAGDDGDPLETLNRFTFAFNDMLDTLFLRPVAFTYREAVPLGLRNAIQSFLRNLATPVILINDLLQGDGERALITAKRFFVNTTFGLGFYDYAEKEGLPYNDADFGQTLGTYGAGEGFYLVLPVLGPSSLRDTTGRIVDTFLDPFTYATAGTGTEGREISAGRSGLEGVDGRSRNIDTLDQARADALDDYVRVRSLWRQLRQDHILKREDPSAEGPDFGSGPIRQF